MPGPFLFAWVDVSETAFGPEHQVEDEDVFSFQLEHAEGEFANLTVEIRNPRIGLLSPGRKRWAWLSWNNGSEVIPLFFGRLVGVPGNLQQEIVTLQFTARPADYDARKQSLAETLKVAPYYDPVWIAADKRDDPDVVLEARSQIWHIDRVSHAVTVSDLLVGEDGLLEFPESAVLYDSVEIALEQSPLRRVTVNAEINWTQSATGQVPLQSAYIATATGEDLAGNWFKPDASLGGGWSVASASVADVSGVSAVAADKFEKAAVLPESAGFEFVHVSDQHNVQPWVVPKDWLFYETVNWTFLTAYLHEGVILPRWLLKTELTGKFDVGRQRRERISLTLQSDVQPIMTLPDDNEALVLTLNSEDVGVAIDGEAPIGDVARSSYIVTDRGRQSLEYLIALARAHLLMRSRAVKISFSVPFALAVGLSCRKNALIRDPRLPGGQAVGKVTSYRLSANGDSGELAATITIGCAVGYGGAVADASGEPAYVADDYVDGDYQFYANRLVALPSSDVAYTPPADAVVDDGLNFVSGIRQRDVVVATSVENDWASQLDTALGYLTSQSSVLENTTETITKSRAEGLKKAMDASPTVINLTLKPVEGGPFVALYNVETSALVIPAQINLEAAAA